KVDTLSFITSFHGSSLLSDSESGSSQVNLVVYKSNTNVMVGRSTAVVVDELLNYKTDVNPCTAAASTTCSNPPGGVFICVQSRGTKQHALIALGGDTIRASANASIEDGPCL